LIFSRIFRDKRLTFGLKIRIRVGRKPFRHVVGERAENFIARDKSVSLFTSTNADLAVGRDVLAIAPSFASRAAFTAAVAMPFFAQDIHRRVEVAVRLGQAFLQSSCPRRSFPELANVCRSNFSHKNS